MPTTTLGVAGPSSSAGAVHVTGDLPENGTTGSIDVHLQAEDSTGSIAPGVAAPGTAYPVEIAGSGDRTGTPTLSEFGGNQPIAAPPSPLDQGRNGA